MLKYDSHIIQHAQQNLKPVQQNSVSGLSGLRARSLGCTGDVDVGVEEGEPDQDQEGGV